MSSILLRNCHNFFTLGRLYEETTQLDKAHNAYTAFVSKAKAEDPLVAKANNNLENIEAKKRLMERQYEIHLQPMPVEINSAGHESLGRWTLDGKKFIFTRKVNEQEDLVIAYPDSTGHFKLEDFPYNTPQNEGAHAISGDGRYLIFTSCNRPDGMGGCDMYISIFKEGKWTKPVNMGQGFNTAAYDGQPAFGIEGQTIYFSSNREGGYGGRDIWFMYQIYGDNWSNPKILVPESTHRTMKKVLTCLLTGSLCITCGMEKMV